MRNLMGQDDLDLFVGVVRQHGVRDENAPRRSEPGQRRVRLAALLAEPPLVGAEHAGVGPLGERQQADAKRFTRQRFHAVEERQQQHRREVRQTGKEQREEQP